MDGSDAAKPPSTRPAGATWALAATSAALLSLATLALAPPNDPRSASTVSQAEPGPPILVTFDPGDAEELSQVLGLAWEAAGERRAVPNLAPERLPAGLGHLEVRERKKTFLRSVLPHVLEVNRGIRQDRAALLSFRQRLLRGEPVLEVEMLLLLGVAERYRVGEVATTALRGEGDLGGVLDRLLARVDVVPPSLALAQAALESAWGSSRFAREGNNLFGQWVFSSEKGMAPRQRPSGADYAVARFGGLREAVVAYMHNLNTFWAYEEFRSIRAGLRREERPLDPHALARGLELYSERREAYVEEVLQVIRGNRLARFDDLRLTRVESAELESLLSAHGRLTVLSRPADPAPDA